MSRLVLFSEKPVISLWVTEYGVEIDLVQDPNGVVTEIMINDEGEETTYCISNDQELQYGAIKFCGEGDAECFRGGLSREN